MWWGSAFNPSTWEAKAGRSASSRSTWYTSWVPGWVGLHKETLSQKGKGKGKGKSSEFIFLKIELCVCVFRNTHMKTQRRQIVLLYLPLAATHAFGTLIFSLPRRETSKPQQSPHSHPSCIWVASMHAWPGLWVPGYQLQCLWLWGKSLHHRGFPVYTHFLR